MKYKSAITSSLVAMVSCLGQAHAATPYHHANAITANNIAVMQHSIISTAMGAGDRMAATVLRPEEIFAHKTQKNEKQPNPASTYGRAPIYGTAPMYGEYNDDGSVGRSGGDNTAPTLGHTWFAWQHFGNNTKFDELHVLESDMELAMVGLAGDKLQTEYGMSEWGLFTGYVGGDQAQDGLSIDEDGGYFGAYKKLTSGRASISLVVNSGVLSNQVNSITYNKIAATDDFTNIWAGGGFSAAYTIPLDNSFIFRPSVYAGYTWIKSDNYTTASGDILTNKDYNMFEISPAIRFIKHIGNGWFGAMHAKYVMIFDEGGETKVNGTKIGTLDSGHFTEYGLSLEKTIDRFNITANIGRRDGSHTGWMGGFNLKYIF